MFHSACVHGERSRQFVLQGKSLIPIIQIITRISKKHLRGLMVSRDEETEVKGEKGGKGEESQCREAGTRKNTKHDVATSANYCTSLIFRE